jgi:hypothetical protein
MLAVLLCADVMLLSDAAVLAAKMHRCQRNLLAPVNV